MGFHFRIARLASYFALAGVIASCTTSPLGRKQLMLAPESQVDQMGAQSFEQLKQQTPIDTDPKDTNFVKCVAGPIIEIAKGPTGISQWEVVVFKSNEINAFALPGGKIGVYSGILPVTKNDAQLATVLAHETGHVIAKHGNERISQSLITQYGVQALDAILLGKASPVMQQVGAAALGLGAQVGVVLPFSRQQEEEADLIGLKNMAKAGFDPRQSVELWKNMMSMSGGNKPPAILSDHPPDEARIQALQQHMPEALQLYQQAQAEGKHPSCKHP